jgi:hypothetical protein
LEIVDKAGWRKTFRLEKGITHIGSAGGNDVVLESWRGGGVAARHLQLIALPSGGARYRLVNLAGVPLQVSGADVKTIDPRSFADVSGSAQVRVGEFTLVLNGDGARPSPAQASGVAAAAATATAVAAGAGAPATGQRPDRPPAPSEPASVEPDEGTQPVVEGAEAQGAATDLAAAGEDGSAMGVTLSLPRTELSPDRPLDGVITVRNLGEVTGVQFHMELQGLERDRYDIGPAPILFPNAERQVSLQLRHPKRPSPPAGSHTVTVRVTAPDAYPGEEATASAAIDILPYRSHRLALLPGEGDGQEEQHTKKREGG